MELIKVDLLNNNIPKNIVCCIGVFDGVHLGHQKLIEEVICRGNLLGLKKAIITFNPHPDSVINNKDEKYITPLNEKIEIINTKFDIDYFIVISFNSELSKISYIEFFNSFLKNINCIVVGYDFTFGYLGEGNVNKLKQLHDNVIVIEKISYGIDNEKISSKKIVELLSLGNVSLITRMLNNRFYKIKGVVEHGSHIGSEIGFPTANINLSSQYYSMRNGVYAVRVTMNNEIYLGIANYGCNPSFNKIMQSRLEVNIFNFNKDIYNKVIEVEFIEFIRDEIMFDSIDDFKIQLKKDIEKCNLKYGGCYEIINRWGNGQ